MSVGEDNKEFSEQIKNRVTEWEGNGLGYFTRSMHSKLFGILASDVSNSTLDSNSLVHDVEAFMADVSIVLSR